MRALILVAAVCGLGLTAAGAAGAHLIADGERLASTEPVGVWTFPAGQWNSALLYGFVHAVAALAAASQRTRLRAAAGWAMAAGVVLFSGVQIATLLWAGLAETPAGVDPGAAPPTPFDAVSWLIPVGGLSFMAGWVLLGASALLGPKRAAEPDLAP